MILVSIASVTLSKKKARSIYGLQCMLNILIDSISMFRSTRRGASWRSSDRKWHRLREEICSKFERYLAEYRFLDVLGLSWGESGGRGGVTDDTLSDRVECAIAGTSLGSKILLNSDSTMSTHSESCTGDMDKNRSFIF